MHPHLKALTYYYCINNDDDQYSVGAEVASKCLFDKSITVDNFFLLFIRFVQYLQSIRKLRNWLSLPK